MLPRKDEKPNDINGCIVKSDRLLEPRSSTRFGWREPQLLGNEDFDRAKVHSGKVKRSKHAGRATQGLIDELI